MTDRPLDRSPRKRLPLRGLQLTDKARDAIGVPTYVPVALVDLPYRDDRHDRRPDA